jgi:hypothetical protein
MRTLGKSTVLGMAFLMAAVTAANADPEYRAGATAAATVINGVSGSGPFGSSEFPSRQIAALPPTDTSPSTPYSATLPDVTVYPQPYYSGGPRASSYSAPRTEHYSVPWDYAANAALHPYSSGLGPRASSHGTIRAEHYQMPPDFDTNVAMHPYTSLLGPCPEGRNGSGCNRPAGSIIRPSHHNR